MEMFASAILFIGAYRERSKVRACLRVSKSHNIVLYKLLIGEMSKLHGVMRISPVYV